MIGLKKFLFSTNFLSKLLSNSLLLNSFSIGRTDQLANHIQSCSLHQLVTTLSDIKQFFVSLLMQVFFFFHNLVILLLSEIVIFIM